MIDLHCHSVFSDGAHTLEELIEIAEHNRLSCLSLTDHDTLAAYPAIVQLGSQRGIQIIPGIEFSTRWKKQDIHILGYQMKESQGLSELIENQSQRRAQRAQAIGEALELMGIEEAYNKACALAGHHRVGRPHFARVLVNEGRARDMKAAFKQFLVRGKSAYIPTSWISVQEAVEGLIEAGGMAVIAHPLKYGLTRSKLHELINEFREAGGEGIEVVSGEMTRTEIKEMAATSIRFQLLASSGSDFHSKVLSRISLGKQPPLPENCNPIWSEWKV